jgi:calcineurin-like phosphoesterase family protein
MDVVMTVWFTADLHLGHANIIGYSCRPFHDVDAMNEALVARWNECVAPQDTVWVLGDVALGHIEDSLAHVGRLAGRKRLLAGNHDRCWAGHGRRAEEWAERYLQAGFDEIHQGELMLPLGDTDVVACHFPYRGDSHDQDRYLDHRPADRGVWLLHGHVHERWRQRGRMLNVGVDAWDYRPVNAVTLAEIVSSGPNDRPTSADRLL